jgi:hypothetical protein
MGKRKYKGPIRLNYIIVDWGLDTKGDFGPYNRLEEGKDKIKERKKVFN